MAVQALGSVARAQAPRPAFRSYVSEFLTLVLFFVVAAAAFGGFVSKWGLRDTDSRFNIVAIYNLEADRPFVFRQLIPTLARLVDGVVPEKAKQLLVSKVHPQSQFTSLQTLDGSITSFRYVVILIMVFFSIVIALYGLRIIVFSLTGDRLIGAFAAVVVVLLYPYILTGGGYYYDFPELMFMSWASYYALRRGIWSCAFIAALATLNKETFVFFLPCLIPLAVVDLKQVRSWACMLPSVIISSIINIAVRIWFAGNGGGNAEFHLIENVEAYLKPATYLEADMTYGWPGPGGANLVSLVAFGAALIGGWAAADIRVKRQFLVAAVVSLPLFLAFAATGELRNLSFIFVPAMLIVASGVVADRREAYKV